MTSPSPSPRSGRAGPADDEGQDEDLRPPSAPSKARRTSPPRAGVENARKQGWNILHTLTVQPHAPVQARARKQGSAEPAAVRQGLSRLMQASLKMSDRDRMGAWKLPKKFAPASSRSRPDPPCRVRPFDLLSLCHGISRPLAGLAPDATLGRAGIQMPRRNTWIRFRQDAKDV